MLMLESLEYHIRHWTPNDASVHDAVPTNIKLLYLIVMDLVYFVLTVNCIIMRCYLFHVLTNKLIFKLNNGLTFKQS